MAQVLSKIAKKQCFREKTKARERQNWMLVFRLVHILWVVLHLPANSYFYLIWLLFIHSYRIG